MSRHRLEAAAAIALVAVFVWQCVRAERADAPTYDETTHLPAGHLHLTRGDYRWQVDHPPVAKMLSAVPLLLADVRLPAVPIPAWRADLANRFAHREWAWWFLYGTPGNEAERLLRLGRLVTVAIGVALLGLLWAWSRALLGAVPALLTLSLAVVDPNLVAHGHLVTPDIAVTAATLGVLYALWRTLLEVRPVPLIAAGLGLGCGLATKYTALLLVPVVGLALLARAVAGGPWPIGAAGRAATTRAARLRVAAAVGVVIVGLAWGTVWAAYGFRAAAAPGAAVELTERASRVWFTERRPWLVETLAGAARGGLLPDAWSFGLLYLWADSRLTPRTFYLAGGLSADGWWYYFPATLALKVPLPTLALAGMGLAVVAVGRWPRWGSSRQGSEAPAALRWALVCVLPAAGIVLGGAMLSRLNIGLRQVLPVYPVLLLAAGLGLRACLRARRPWGPALVAGALAWTWVASFAVAPYHLAYFNELAGRPENHPRWLVDSNLDWGQALRVLPGWLRAHGIHQVNLCYFGTADPAAYDIPHVPLPGCTTYREPAAEPQLPGYVAISATHLAGVHFSPELREWYRTLLSRGRLVGTAGHAIHVYALPVDGATGPAPLPATHPRPSPP